MTQTPPTAGHLDPAELNAFSDGELASNESLRVQQHLADCHPCALRVISATRLKAATAQLAERFNPQPEALARLAAQLRPQNARRPGLTYRLRFTAWVALAASLLLAASLAGWWQALQTDALSAELLDQHLATLSSGASPEVLSTDRHTVKPWFQGRLPFSFNLPDALPADATLKGGNLTYLGGEPAALLLFTIHRHEVSVFLLQRSRGPLAAVLPGVRSGFAVRSAMTHDLRIVAVSDVNPADLDLLVLALSQAQSPG